MQADVMSTLGSHSRRAIVVAARIGYAAKGMVYTVLGLLALLTSLGMAGGKLTDSKGVITEIGTQPFGAVLLWATALGLLCYALWNGVRAVLDPEHKGSDGKGALKRVGYAVSCIVHVFLAVFAAKLAYGAHAERGGAPSSVSKLMALPLGTALVFVAGAVFVGFGLTQIYLAAKGKVGQQYASAPLSRRLCTVVHRLARVGVLCRGLVFPVIGSSLIVAALEHNPREADGFGQALGRLAQGPLGMGLLTFIAAGLMAYGVHLFFVARYGHLPEPR
jgi:hypothetical protein